ncbi:hypothetical protein C8J57DRAFT_1439087 [Mycena rebaudengoi]|nr:hypothetical protein C8J57DRAFT_1439087 [Mycena rebaudengoi]
MLRTLQMDQTLTPGISFHVTNHRANAIELVGVESGLTGTEILHISSQNRYKNAEVLQFSLSNSSSEEGSYGRDFTAKISNLVPKGNGFVDTVISAYSQHHALIIRPDDVWLSILVQFNFFVNANTELLRGNSVAHEGKKHLVVSGVGTRYSIDFGAMSREMVGLMEKNIVDPKLHDWILPNFSTTTITDTTASAVIMMATLKIYFSYEFYLTCGIPRVTLEGEKSDWANILGRLEKLKEYGVEAIAWYHLLHPVISHFVAAFDAPASRENINFWQRVAHYHTQDSGPSYYSGWISAFAVFSPTGEWLGNWLDNRRKWDRSARSNSGLHNAPYAAKDLVLDSTPYYRVDSINVPPGYAGVDVKLNDNGELFDCMMTAGVIGMKVSSSRDVELSPTGRDDIVRPVSGWWIFIKG